MQYLFNVKFIFMAGCTIAVSKAKTCDTIKKIGGISSKLYLFNLEAADGSRIVYTEAGNTISALNLGTGNQGYEVDGEKYSHDWGYGLSKPATNKYFSQTLNIRTIIDGETDLTWLSEVFTATNLVAIIETNDQKFIVLGQKNGLVASDGDAFSSGQEAASDVSTTVALMGEEIEAPFKYLDVGTGYDDTLLYIQSLLVPQV